MSRAPLFIPAYDQEIKLSSILQLLQERLGPHVRIVGYENSPEGPSLGYGAATRPPDSELYFPYPRICPTDTAYGCLVK